MERVGLLPIATLKKLSTAIARLTANLITLNVEKTRYLLFFPPFASKTQQSLLVKAHICGYTSEDYNCLTVVGTNT